MRLALRNKTHQQLLEEQREKVRKQQLRRQRKEEKQRLRSSEITEALAEHKINVYWECPLIEAYIAGKSKSTLKEVVDGVAVESYLRSETPYEFIYSANQHVLEEIEDHFWREAQAAAKREHCYLWPRYMPPVGNITARATAMYHSIVSLHARRVLCETSGDVESSSSEHPQTNSRKRSRDGNESPMKKQKLSSEEAGMREASPTSYDGERENGSTIYRQSSDESIVVDGEVAECWEELETSPETYFYKKVVVTPELIRAWQSSDKSGAKQEVDSLPQLTAAQSETSGSSSQNVRSIFLEQMLGYNPTATNPTEYFQLANQKR